MSTRKSFIFTVLLSLTAASAFVEELEDIFMETKGPEETWLIEFYAPWCSFCQQLDPVWHQIGSELKSAGSPVHVGKSDGTVHVGLAKEFNVRGYPTISMLKNDFKYEYIGPRNKDGIMDFADRIAGPLVRVLSSTQLFQHVMSRHDVLFVYVGGSSHLKRTYIEAAEELIVHTYFFSASRDVLPKLVSIPVLPAVTVFKDGTYFTYNEEDDGELKSWINRERFLSYCKIDSYTLYGMGDTGKFVALALVDERIPSVTSIRYKTLLETAATDHKQLSRHFYFGYMEGNEYINGLVMGEVSVPSVIVVDLSTDGYFLPLGAMETEQQLLDFLNGVRNNSIQCQGGNGIIQRCKRIYHEVRTTVTSIFSQAPLLGCFLVLLPVVLGAFPLYICCKKKKVPNELEDLSGEEKRPRGKKQKALADKKAD